MTLVVPVAAASSAAAVANFAGLSASVARWLNRTDLTAVIPDFVRMAEAEFSRDTRLRSSFQVVDTSGYTPAGEIPLPVDMLELRELSAGGTVLRELPYEDWRQRSDGPHFARLGEVAHITGKPATAYGLKYLQKLPALVFQSDSNWLLREHYDVYLWKCCEMGSAWMRDPEAVASYSAKYEGAVQQLLSAHNAHRWAGASVAVMAPGVV